jgi:hypothetical protein
MKPNKPIPKPARPEGLKGKPSIGSPGKKPTPGRPTFPKPPLGRPTLPNITKPIPQKPAPKGPDKAPMTDYERRKLTQRQTRFLKAKAEATAKKREELAPKTDFEKLFGFKYGEKSKKGK